MTKITKIQVHKLGMKDKSPVVTKNLLNGTPSTESIVKKILEIIEA